MASELRRLPRRAARRRGPELASPSSPTSSSRRSARTAGSSASRRSTSTSTARGMDVIEYPWFAAEQPWGGSQDVELRAGDGALVSPAPDDRVGTGWCPGVSDNLLISRDGGEWLSRRLESRVGEIGMSSTAAGAVRRSADGPRQLRGRGRRAAARHARGALRRQRRDDRNGVVARPEGRSPRLASARRLARPRSPGAMSR